MSEVPNACRSDGLDYSAIRRIVRVYAVFCAWLRLDSPPWMTTLRSRQEWCNNGTAIDAQTFMGVLL